MIGIIKDYDYDFSNHMLKLKILDENLDERTVKTFTHNLDSFTVEIGCTKLSEINESVICFEFLSSTLIKIEFPDNKLALSRLVKLFTKYLKERYENGPSNTTTI